VQEKVHNCLCLNILKNFFKHSNEIDSMYHYLARTIAMTLYVQVSRVSGLLDLSFGEKEVVEGEVCSLVGFGRSKTSSHILPVSHIENSLHIVWSDILVLQVVGVFPNVNAKEGD